MAFDQKTRNLLQRTVTACRRVFDREFTAQLQELYGIQPDGALTPCAELDHLADEELEVARLLRSRINHLEDGEPAVALTRTQAKPENVARVIREQAFTVLNRLAALRLCEERGLVLECVRRSVNSEGFQLFLTSAGNALGEAHEAYRIYLNCVFDELALDFGVLFDRFSPLALVFPRKAALEEVLRELNGSGKAAENEAISIEQFADIWKADETIGWIYQYYNDEAERKKMRKKSAAPRDSRELAVRNQFFTPRYVVEFLTDNTLGRLWYEMRYGETVLRDRCALFVRRPIEIFLKPGEAAPESSCGIEASQAEWIRRPVHIPHRTLKDPREIRLLDPACGSMHFGLYAFDLFTVIYEEAWDIARGQDEEEKSTETFAPFVNFAATFSDKAEFLLEVPRLIIEHNIHGIDIDARAAQIAGLSLWLRAQRAWHEAGVKPADRPCITRSNIVCAEPMPGEKKLLREFVDQQFDMGERPAFAFLLEKIFDHMALAGEAGSLLRIEEEIRSAITEANGIARTQTAPRQTELFTGEECSEPKQLDLKGLLDEHFWRMAEQRIYDSLEIYAKQAEIGGGFQRRLFANDAAMGFAFIDLCRKRYDVVVMNPPFGAASLPSKPYIDDTYGDTKGDVYKAFVECFQLRLVSSGYLGILSSRTGFFLSQSEDWRTRVVLRLFRPIVLADLGSGVLDAMVEVAAYVLRNLSQCEERDLTLSLLPTLERVIRDRQDRFSLPKWQTARGGLKRHQAVAELERLESHGFVQRSSGEVTRYSPLWGSVREAVMTPAPAFPPLICIRALVELDKAIALAQGVHSLGSGNTFVCNPQGFFEIPTVTFAYWAGEKVRALFRPNALFANDGREARRGPSTGDDARRVRCWWEIRPFDNSRQGGWAHLSKGGKFSPYYYDVFLVVAWDDQRFTYSGFFGRPGRMLAKLESSDCLFRPGLTWPRRSQKGLAVRPLPANCIFADKSPTAFLPENDQKDLLAFLAIANSSAFRGLIALQMAVASYETGVFQRTPVPILEEDTKTRFAELAFSAWESRRLLGRVDSCSHEFIVPALLATSGTKLNERAAAWGDCVRKSVATVAAIQSEIDDIAFRLYGLDAVDRSALTAMLTLEASAEDEEAEDDETEDEGGEDIASDAKALVADLLSYIFGAVFGRWDIRYALADAKLTGSPDPFAQLPVCPPGMLQGDNGLPLSPEVGRELRADGQYPLGIAWDGIVVDDPEHPLDFERQIHAAFAVLWADRADVLEHEACGLLGAPTLRDWFCRPAGYFSDHLKRYSKSRRQAPIYWPLSSPNGLYTLWLYYHRLTPDTLFKCLQQFVVPKLAGVEKELNRLRTVLAANEGGVKEKNRLEELEDLRGELIELRSELELWAPKWKPNLNDGVLITAAPLWKLFRLPKWQKDLKACWQELEKGGYDWAHLAHSLWPDRVREKCKTDRSLAITHGLEDLCEVKVPVKRAKKSKTSKAEDDQQELPKD